MYDFVDNNDCYALGTRFKHYFNPIDGHYFPIGEEMQLPLGLDVPTTETGREYGRALRTATLLVRAIDR